MLCSSGMEGGRPRRDLFEVITCVGNEVGAGATTLLRVGFVAVVDKEGDDD